MAKSLVSFLPMVSYFAKFESKLDLDKIPEAFGLALGEIGLKRLTASSEGTFNSS